MANFAKAIKHIFLHEGGFQANPNDSGNYNSKKQLVGTNLGITAIEAEKYLGYPPTKKDMLSFKKEWAETIYFEKYWTPIKGEKLESQKVATIFLDYAVNCGVKTAIKRIQRILKIQDDGIFGDITLEAINQAADDQRFFDEIIKDRKNYYAAIVRNNGKLSVFLTGWYKRVEYFSKTQF